MAMPFGHHKAEPHGDEPDFISALPLLIRSYPNDLKQLLGHIQDE
jgi:hypothetical protein